MNTDICRLFAVLLVAFGLVGAVGAVSGPTEIPLPPMIPRSNSGGVSFVSIDGEYEQTKTLDNYTIHRWMINRNVGNTPDNYHYQFTIKQGGTYTFSSHITNLGDTTFSGKMKGSIVVDCAEPVTIILEDVDIQAGPQKSPSIYIPNNAEYYQLRAAISIENNSNVTIQLKGSNTLLGYDDGHVNGNTMMSSAGIYVENTYSDYTSNARVQRLASLTIEDYPGDDAIGSLYAKGGYQSAGIGGNSNRLAGNITINSGDIHAVGGDWGCGVGDGDVFRTKGKKNTDDDYTCDVEQIEYYGEGLRTSNSDKNTFQSRYMLGRNTSHASIIINGGTVVGEATTDTPGIGTSDELPSRWRALQGEVWEGKTIVVNSGVVVALSGQTRQASSSAFGPGSSTILPARLITINRGLPVEGEPSQTNWTFMVVCTRTSEKGWAASYRGGFQYLPQISTNSTATVWNLALDPNEHLGRNLNFYKLSGVTENQLVWPAFPNNYLHDESIFGDKYLAGMSVVVPYLDSFVLVDGGDPIITGYLGGDGSNNVEEGGYLHRSPAVTPPSDEYVLPDNSAKYVVTGLARDGATSLKFEWYRCTPAHPEGELLRFETRAVDATTGTAESSFHQNGVTESMEGYTYFCKVTETGSDGVARTVVSESACLHVPMMDVKSNVEIPVGVTASGLAPSGAKVCVQVASVGAGGTLGTSETLDAKFNLDGEVVLTPNPTVEKSVDDTSTYLSGSVRVPSCEVVKVLDHNEEIRDLEPVVTVSRSTVPDWYWIEVDADTGKMYYPSTYRTYVEAANDGKVYTEAQHLLIDIPVKVTETSKVEYRESARAVSYPVYNYVTNYYAYTMTVETLKYGSDHVEPSSNQCGGYVVPTVDNSVVRVSDVKETAVNNVSQEKSGLAALTYVTEMDAADGQLKVVLSSEQMTHFPPEITDPDDQEDISWEADKADFTVTGTAKEGATALTFIWYESYDGGLTWTAVDEQKNIPVNGEHKATSTHVIVNGARGWQEDTLVYAEVYETSILDHQVRSTASIAAMLTHVPGITTDSTLTVEISPYEWRWVTSDEPATFTAYGETSSDTVTHLYFRWRVKLEDDQGFAQHGGEGDYKNVWWEVIPVKNGKANMSFTIDRGSKFWDGVNLQDAVLYCTVQEYADKVYGLSVDSAETRLILMDNRAAVPPEVTDPADVAFGVNEREPAVFTAVGTAHEGADKLTFKWYYLMPEDDVPKVGKEQTLRVGADGTATVTYTIEPAGALYVTGAKVWVEVDETSPKDNITRKDTSEKATLSLARDESLLPPEITNPENTIRHSEDVGNPAYFNVEATARAGAVELTFVGYAKPPDVDYFVPIYSETVQVDSETHTASTSMTGGWEGIYFLEDEGYRGDFWDEETEDFIFTWQDGTEVYWEVYETSPLDFNTRKATSEIATLTLVDGRSQLPEVLLTEDVTLPTTSLVPAVFTATGVAKEGADELTFTWTFTVPGLDEAVVKTEKASVDPVTHEAVLSWDIWPDDVAFKNGTVVKVKVTEVSPLDGETRESSEQSARLYLTPAGEETGRLRILPPADVYAIEGETSVFEAYGVPGNPSTTELKFMWFRSTDNGETWTECVNGTEVVDVDATKGYATSRLTVPGVGDTDDGTRYRAVAVEGTEMVQSEFATLRVPEIPVIPNVVLDPALPESLTPTAAKAQVMVMTTDADGKVVAGWTDIGTALGADFLASGVPDYVYDATSQAGAFVLHPDAMGKVLTGELDLPAYLVTRTETGLKSVTVVAGEGIVDCTTHYEVTTTTAGTPSIHTTDPVAGENGLENTVTIENGEVASWDDGLQVHFFPKYFVDADPENPDHSVEVGCLNAWEAGLLLVSVDNAVGDDAIADAYARALQTEASGSRVTQVVGEGGRPPVSVKVPTYSYTTNFLAYTFETTGLQYETAGEVWNYARDPGTGTYTGRQLAAGATGTEWVEVPGNRRYSDETRCYESFLSTCEATSVYNLNEVLSAGDVDVAWNPQTGEVDGQLREVLKPVHVTVEEPWSDMDDQGYHNGDRWTIDVVGPGTLTWKERLDDPCSKTGTGGCPEATATGVCGHEKARLKITIDDGEDLLVYVGQIDRELEKVVFGGDMDTKHRVEIEFVGNGSGSEEHSATAAVIDVHWEPYANADYADVKAAGSEPFTLKNLGTEPLLEPSGITVLNEQPVVTISTVNTLGKQMTSTVVTGTPGDETTGTEDFWYAIQDPGPSNVVGNTVARTAPTLSKDETTVMTVSDLVGPCKFSWDMMIADPAAAGSTLEVVVTKRITDEYGNPVGESTTTTYTYTADDIASWTHGYLPLNGPWSSGNAVYEVAFRYTNRNDEHGVDGTSGDKLGYCQLDNLKVERPDLNLAPELHDAGVQPENGSAYGADAWKRPDPTSPENVNLPENPYYPQYTVENDDLHPWEVVPDPKSGDAASDPGKANDDVAQTPDTLAAGGTSKVVVQVTGDGEFSWKSFLDAKGQIFGEEDHAKRPQVMVKVDGREVAKYDDESDWTRHAVHVTDAEGADEATHTIEIIYTQDTLGGLSTGYFDNFNWQHAATQEEMDQLVLKDAVTVKQSVEVLEGETVGTVEVANEKPSGWLPIYETQTNPDGTKTSITVGVRSADGAEGLPGGESTETLHSTFEVDVDGPGTLWIGELTFPIYDLENPATPDSGHFTLTITDSWDDDGDPSTPDKTVTHPFDVPVEPRAADATGYSVTVDTENGTVTVTNLMIPFAGANHVKHAVTFTDDRTAESSTENTATIVKRITWLNSEQAKALWIIDHEDPGEGEVFLAFEPELKVGRNLVEEWVKRFAAANMICVKHGRTRAEAEAGDPVVATLCNDEAHPVRSHKVWIKVALRDEAQQDLSRSSFWRIYITGAAIQLSGMDRGGNPSAKLQGASPNGEEDDLPIIDADGALSPNTFGILQIETTTTNTLIAVPWTWYSKFEDEAADIPVCKLVKTTNLTEGDQLLYYNQKSGTYYVWTAVEDEDSGELVWSADDTVVVKNVVDPKQRGGEIELVKDDVNQPIEKQMSVKRGLGMWLVRQHPVDADGKAIPFWVYGQSVATTVVTPIVAPASPSVSSATEDVARNVVCNILGNPYAKEIAINELRFVDDAGNVVVPDANDRIWVPNGTISGCYVIYRDHDNNPATPMCWYYTKSTLVGRKRVTESVTDVRVPAGLGFWYDRRGMGTMKIVWPVPTE